MTTLWEKNNIANSPVEFGAEITCSAQGERNFNPFNYYLLLNHKL